MKKLLLTVFLSIGFVFGFSSSVLAQTDSVIISSDEAALDPNSIPAIPQDEFSKAKVVSISEEGTTTDGLEQPFQKVKLKILTGSEKDKEIEVEHGGLFAISAEQKVKVGETVVITKTVGPQGELYYITDKYRLEPLLLIGIFFFALVIFFGRLKGVSSLIGLIVSIAILIKFVVPQILAGRDPLFISITGALAIAIITLYMAHGFSKKTSVALISTIITLGIAGIFAVVFVKLTQLSGTGSEEAIFLRMGPIGAIDLKGLLLGGIIIGTLGILDDITTGQTAAVYEIKKANSKLSKMELFRRGSSVGREHIASLINTLALAYAGASFPLLLLFSLGQDIPFWLTLNSEFIVEELVRTLVGSSALILAVPISTFLAAYFLSSETVATAKKSSKSKK